MNSMLELDKRVNYTKLSMFCALSKNYQHFLKNNMSILKQIVWETQKLHQNFNRPSGSWIIDQNISKPILSQEPLGLLKF